MPMNIFSPASQDQSIYFLGQIFGNVGNVLAVSDSSHVNFLLPAVFSTINTIALMAGAIIVIYTTIVGLMATAHEGEFLGKRWGGGGGGIWIPIRMVLGVASLFPASSGYSILQIIVMWIVVQGVGAADAVWTAANKSKSAAEAAEYAGINASSGAIMGADQQIERLFQALVCEETSNPQANPGISNAPEQIKFNTTNFNNSFNPASTAFLFGKNGACGKLKKCSVIVACLKGSQSPECAVCKAQNEVLIGTSSPMVVVDQAHQTPTMGIVGALRAIAKTFVAADSQYISFYYKTAPPALSSKDNWVANYCEANGLTLQPPNATCCVSPAEEPPAFPPPYCQYTKSEDLPKQRQFPLPYPTPTGPVGNGMSPDELSWISSWVMYPLLIDKPAPIALDDPELNKADFISTNTQQYTAALSDAAHSVLDQSPDTAKSDAKKVDLTYGWITAGAYFYRIVRLAHQAIEKTQMPFTVLGPADEINSTPKYRSNYDAASKFVTAISSGNESGELGVSANYQKPLESAGSSLIGSFISMLTGGNVNNKSNTGRNTLLDIATFGQNLLIIAQTTFAVTIVANTAAAIISGAPTYVAVGIGNITSAAEAFRAVTAIMNPAIFALLVSLIGLGALLGMYVPMIPFVIFTAAVIGWFIAVVEAMVAAPIIALGLLSHGGQSEVFGRAEASLMIIFNLFLRPTLMVFGLLAALFLADVVVQLICQGFTFMMNDVMHISSGMVEQIIFITIFTSLIVTSVNQVFTLIYDIPNKILTYMSGGQAVQFGESQASQAAKQAVEGTASAVGGAGKGSAEGAAGIARSLPTSEKDNEKKKAQKNQNMEIKPQ